MLLVTEVSPVWQGFLAPPTKLLYPGFGRFYILNIIVTLLRIGVYFYFRLVILTDDEVDGCGSIITGYEPKYAKVLCVIAY